LLFLDLVAPGVQVIEGLDAVAEDAADRISSGRVKASRAFLARSKAATLFWLGSVKHIALGVFLGREKGLEVAWSEPG